MVSDINKMTGHIIVANDLEKNNHISHSYASTKFASKGFLYQATHALIYIYKMNFLDGGISMKFVAEFRYCSLILLGIQILWHTK
jgi:hypothetical protein